MSVFCRQFASILKAGVSVINALEMLGEQTENKRLKEAIERTQSSVEKGENLSDSMRENEEFPSILVDMIKAGEASGSLENSLTRMAIQFEKRCQVKRCCKESNDVSDSAYLCYDRCYCSNAYICYTKLYDNV